MCVFVTVFHFFGWQLSWDEEEQKERGSSPTERLYRTGESWTTAKWWGAGRPWGQPGRSAGGKRRQRSGSQEGNPEQIPGPHQHRAASVLVVDLIHLFTNISFMLTYVPQKTGRTCWVQPRINSRRFWRRRTSCSKMVGVMATTGCYGRALSFCT